MPVHKWGTKCLEDIEQAKSYLKNIKDEHLTDNMNSWSTFTQPFEEYLKVKGLDGKNESSSFDDQGDIKKRDQFYKSISKNKWAGSNGLDSVLIAYDAFVESKGDWKELCMRGVLHAGDNDSTGSIAGAFYGALYGFNGVSPNNYEVSSNLAALELICTGLTFSALENRILGPFETLWKRALQTRSRKSIETTQ